MDIKNKLLAYGKKSITLEALTDLLKADLADTKGLYDRISELAGASILEPVKNSGQNGNRKYPLFKKYRIMIKEESSEEVEKQIRQLHPALQRTGYLSLHVKEYLKHREVVDCLNTFLFSRKAGEQISRKERSFEIFGREKVLDDPEVKSLLRHLEISESDLGFYDTPEYCFHDYIPERKNDLTLLICENKDIWFNIRRCMFEDHFKSLGKDYTVFYSLSWISIGNDRTIGEADFILFHPVHGIMVIEVKSGEIEYKGGKWIQTNRNSGQKKEISPYVQARKSQYEIFDRIIKHANRTRFTRPMLCYAVWFPSIEFKPNDELPPEAAVEITFDKKSLLNAQSVIEDAYDFWKDKLRVNTRPLSGDDTRCVMDVLCPYFHAVPKLGTTINESEHIYIRLTNQQIALLDFLVEQDTAVIHGLAGTGKTVLAIEKAKMLAAQGESVLFLCYNSFLRDSLRENNTIPGVVFHNAHSLAYEIMGATDSKIDDVLAEFEEYLEVVFDKENWKYKNVIVDEGQDLDDRLLNRLYDLSKSKKGSFYVFYDKNQFIMKKRQPHWLEDAECRLVLSKNCRNTAEIFKTACSIIGKENLTLNEIHGEVPFLRFYSTEKEMTAIVEGFLERMKKGEVPADKITILSASTLDNSFIDAKRKYAGFELSEKREPGKVHFTTIRKFKGLEAEAILVVDASMIGLKSEEDRRLLYVGVSRAKNYLEIAMNQDIADSELGDYLHALNPNRSLPRNKKGLKRLLNVDI